MIYTDLDFFILKEIYQAGLNKKETTTWEIAKKYQWDDKTNFKNKKEEERFLMKKSDKICKRLKRMAKEDLIIICKERKNKNSYNLDKRKVIFKKRHKFPDGFGKALFIKEKDKKWQIFQL